MRRPSTVAGLVVLACAAVVVSLAPARAMPTATVDVAAGSYAGPLFSVSEKVNDNPRVLTKLLPNMARNDVRSAVLYFGAEGRADDAAFIARVIKRAPGVIVPFYSTGRGGAWEGREAGPRLLKAYRAALAALRQELGTKAIKGIGEIELMTWRMPHDDPRIMTLLDFAAKNGLAVMLHPRLGQLEQFEALVAKYPTTVFLMHMFARDQYGKVFEDDRDALIDLMSRRPNVYYTVDVDHMLLGDRGGLLYAFADLPPDRAARAFRAAFDTGRESMLAASLAKYLPLVQAHPDRVMWGTEMSTDYSYETSVYDRVIAFARAWIGGLPASAQEGVAYGNARRVLGPGVTLR
ncbi:MAG: amidohydrolase family protein [Actinomycetota bacterium]|nr:amidohydrolase family protein [Actinomycetota bacterium]